MTEASTLRLTAHLALPQKPAPVGRRPGLGLHHTSLLIMHGAQASRDLADDGSALLEQRVLAAIDASCMDSRQLAQLLDNGGAKGARQFNTLLKARHPISDEALVLIAEQNLDCLSGYAIALAFRRSRALGATLVALVPRCADPAHAAARILNASPAMDLEFTAALTALCRDAGSALAGGLEHAAAQNDLARAELLLAAGADPTDLAVRYAKSARMVRLLLARDYVYSDEQRHALVKAAAGAHSAALLAHVAERVGWSTDVSTPGQFNRLLSSAQRNKSTHALSWLLKRAPPGWIDVSMAYNYDGSAAAHALLAAHVLRTQPAAFTTQMTSLLLLAVAPAGAALDRLDATDLGGWQIDDMRAALARTAVFRIEASAASLPHVRAALPPTDAAPWLPGTHLQMAPTLRATVRTLLLIRQRQRRQGLGAVPFAVLIVAFDWLRAAQPDPVVQL